MVDLPWLTALFGLFTFYWHGEFPFSLSGSGARLCLLPRLLFGRSICCFVCHAVVLWFRCSSLTHSISRIVNVVLRLSHMFGLWCFSVWCPEQDVKLLPCLVCFARTFVVLFLSLLFALVWFGFSLSTLVGTAGERGRLVVRPQPEPHF